MDELKEKINKLKMLKYKIERMPDNIQKAETILGYTELLGYIKEAYDFSPKECMPYDLEIEDITKNDRHVVLDTGRKISEFEKVSPFIYQKFDELIKEYKKYNFCSFPYENFHQIDMHTADYLLSEFFYSLEKDVYKIYHQMSDGNNIFMSVTCDYLGISMDTKKIDNSCIVVQKAENYLDFYFTLAHEMGHCYQFYLQRNQPTYSSFDIMQEVSSLLFEKLFRNYLEKRKMYLKDISGYDLEDQIYFLNDISASKVLCNLINNKDMRNIDAYSLSYETPYFMDDLLQEMVSDCGYIMPNKLNLEMTEIFYAIGNIIATKLVQKIESDFTKGWREYKDLICTANYLPMMDILNEYLDIDMMKENIKGFMKSYRK